MVAARNSIPWTAQENELLRKLAASGEDLSKIANQLGSVARLGSGPRAKA